MCFDLSCLQGYLSFSEIVLLLAAALVSGLFHTLSGFAGGMLLSLLIAPIVGVAAVVPILSISLVISAISRAWIFRKLVDWTIFLQIMVPALPGIVVGAFIYGHLDSCTISTLLGFFLVGSTVWRRAFIDQGKPVGSVGLGVAGAVFGAVSGITIGGGMLLAPFLLGRGLRREYLAAIFAVIGLTLNFTKSAVFLGTQTLTTQYAVLGVVLGLSTLPGTLLGMAILKRTSIRVHTWWVELLVVIGGIGFVWNGILE